MSRDPQHPNVLLNSSLLSLHAQLNQETAVVQRFHCRTHRTVGCHTSNLATLKGGGLTCFFFSKEEDEKNLQRGRTIKRCSTLFPSYACGEHHLMSGNRATKPTMGSQSLVGCGPRHSLTHIPTNSQSHTRVTSHPQTTGRGWVAR